MFSFTYQQLSAHLNEIAVFKSIHVPAKGWVRAIRDGLGMSRRQLANKLGLSTSRIQRLEEDEVVGAVTIKTMRRTAEAMDCVFVYAVIPRSSLGDTLHKQARKKASEHLAQVSHSMALESQSIDDQAQEAMLDALAQQMIEKSKRSLWD